MAFDPCGTRKLEGDEILKRLAACLDTTESELRIALICAILSSSSNKNNP